MPYRIATAMAQFDGWSGTYDRSILQRLFFGPSHRRILDLVEVDGGRILDVGCGTGRFAVEVLQRFPRTQVWGLDLSTRMLNQGISRCLPWTDRIHLVRGDSERLPFADDLFDLVTCSHSFHHYPNQGWVVAEMHRVLRPAGRLMIIDGYRDRWWGWFLFDVIVTCAEGRVHHCSARQFRRLLRAAGFGQVRQQFRRGFLPFVLTIGRADKPAGQAAQPLPEAA